MKNVTNFILLVVLTLIGFISCNENESEKYTFTISGRLVDSTNSSKFRNVKIEAYNTFTAKSFEYLGTCSTNENGEFSLEYNLDNKLSGNYLKLYFDTIFTASSKYTAMPIGESWHKNLYVGDSANVDIFLDRDLSINDTLFLQTSSAILLFVGPTVNKHLGIIRVLNTGQYREYGYALGLNKFTNSKSKVNYIPTGDPIIDQLTLILNN